MKNLLFTVACLLLYITCSFGMYERNIYFERVEELKNICDEAAIGGGLYIDTSAYTEGYVAFDESDSAACILEIIKRDMFLDDAFVPDGNHFWHDAVEVTIWLVDELGVDKVIMQNGTVTQTTSPSAPFPYMLTDSEILNGSRAITRPTVIVKVDAGDADFKIARHLNSGTFRLVRSGAYGYVMK